MRKRPLNINVDNFKLDVKSHNNMQIYDNYTVIRYWPVDDGSFGTVVYDFTPREVAYILGDMLNVREADDYTFEDGSYRWNYV